MTNEIEVSDNKMPILAIRAARLKAVRGGIAFASVNLNCTFGVDAEATCHQEDYGGWFVTSWTVTAPPSLHGPVPAVLCSCGFYAVPADGDPAHDGQVTVTLDVELSGRVIEHEMGYRAQHQRVLACRLPLCFCGDETTCLWFVNGTVAAMGCERHYGDPPRALSAVPQRGQIGGLVFPITRDDLARVLRVPILVEEPTHV